MDLREHQTEGAGAVRHPWETARAEVVRSLLHPVWNKDSGNHLIIDVGSGDAFIARQLCMHDPKLEVIAVDTALNADLIARLNAADCGGRIQMFDSMKNAESKDPRKADAVLLLDVIEHIENVDAFLNEISRSAFIGKDTRILITVPAYASLWVERDVFLGHYRRYTSGSLSITVHKAGWKIESKGYFFLSLIFPRILSVLKEKLLGKPALQNTDVGNWKGSAFLSRMIQGLLLLDFHAGDLLRKAGISVPGLSIFMVCRKPA